MHSDIHIPIAIDLLLAAAFAVVVLNVYNIQMLGGFAFLSQTIINADFNRFQQSKLLPDMQHFLQQLLFALLAYHHRIPWTLSKKVRSGFRVGLARLLAVEIADCLSSAAHQQSIQHLQQMSSLRLVHYQAKTSDKTYKLHRVLTFWLALSLSG